MNETTKVFAELYFNYNILIINGIRKIVKIVYVRSYPQEKPFRQGKSAFFLPVCTLSMDKKRECENTHSLFANADIIAFEVAIRNRLQGILYDGILKF